MTDDERYELQLARERLAEIEAPLSESPHDLLRAAVVIVTYERHEALECTIAQLLEQDLDDFEIVIVDSSRDAEEFFLHQFEFRGHARITYVVSAISNLGVVRNLGLLHTSADVVIFIDDDVYLKRDFVRRHIAVHSGPTGREAFMVCGHVIARPNEPVPWVRHQTEYRPEGKYVQGPMECNWSLKRRKALNRGGFNPYIRQVTDGLEVFRRCVRAPYEALNAPQVVLVHRCARRGGVRGDPRNPARHLCQRYADRVMMAASTVGVWQVPFLLARKHQQWLFSGNVFLLFTWKGLCEYATTFLGYSVRNAYGATRVDRFLALSSRLGRPRVMQQASPIGSAASGPACETKGVPEVL